MNKGVYLDDELKNSASTDFCIGVAGYPEKHFEAPNMNSDIHFLKKKVELGADYIVTQMFFDNKKYFDFVDMCRANDIHVPIIPGLKPLATKRQLTLLTQWFQLNFPEELVKQIIKCKNNEDVRKVGVEWSVAQCRDLINSKVPCIHFYTMGRGLSVKNIAKHIF